VKDFPSGRTGTGSLIIIMISQQPKKKSTAFL
jgi:hypothetical protein